MAGTDPGTGRSNGSRAYETRDVEVKGVAILGSGIVLAIPLTLISMSLLFDHFAARESREQPRRVSLIPREANPLPPSPRLQDNPVADLGTHRVEEAAKLDGYAWIDRSAGRVRIPVSRAMDLLVARGVPARKPKAPEGTTP